jgi:hypothetical protein
MYVDVYCPSMLRSLVSNRVEWYLKKQKMLLFVYYLCMSLFVCSFLTYVECDGRMSREVWYVEWLGFYWVLLVVCSISTIYIEMDIEYTS